MSLTPTAPRLVLRETAPLEPTPDEREDAPTSSVIVLEADAAWPTAVISRLKGRTHRIVLRQTSLEPSSSVWNRVRWHLSRLPRRGGAMEDAVVCFAARTSPRVALERADLCRRLLNELGVQRLRGDSPQCGRSPHCAGGRLVVVMSGAGFGQQAVELGEALTPRLAGTGAILEFRFDEACERQQH